MLDVHPPHSTPHGWRDFSIHIATITLGLLIALGLEGTLEAIHHRHLVREARENIRRELEENRRLAKSDVGYVRENGDLMKANIATLGAMLKSLTLPVHGQLRYNFQWSGFTQSAWLAARDSGALTYMPISEVQNYSDCYTQQEIVNREAVDIFTHQSEILGPLMLTPDDKPFPAEDLQSVRHQTATVYMRLQTLGQLTAALDKDYGDTLGK